MRNFRKHYPTQQQCAHAWAHGISKNGQSSSLYFEGSVIYSYGEHFPIVRIHNHTVFFTEKAYSRTTSSHISISSSAVSHLNYVFVHYVPEDDGDPANNRKFVSQNIDHWISEISKLLELYQFNPRKKSILGEIDKIHQKLLHFVHSLNVRPSISLQTLLHDLSQETLLNFKKSEKRRLAASKKREEKSKLMKFAKTLEKWKRREIVCIKMAHPFDADLAYLRTNPETEQIETSKGINVTLNEAKALYLYIKRYLSCTPAKPSFNIEGFNLSTIDQHFLKVGCHKISMEEVEAIAHRKGWKID
ncbi:MULTISPECIES: hypothetical protein [Sphingobacterium]|uniref:hypothetical protein n=1 Tax=Sphingobacterium TaxID=28453 RepID=UPI002579FAB1|nr:MULTISPECIES: hypothetical protein [Sphingobacterium]